MIKTHLESKDPRLTVCGGSIRHSKGTRTKQFFAFERDRFANQPISDRCKKCQAIFAAEDAAREDRVENLIDLKNQDDENN